MVVCAARPPISVTWEVTSGNVTRTLKGGSEDQGPLGDLHDSYGLKCLDSGHWARMWANERKRNPRAVAEGCTVLERVATKWGQCLAALWQSVGGEAIGTMFPDLHKGWAGGRRCVCVGWGVRGGGGGGCRVIIPYGQLTQPAHLQPCTSSCLLDATWTLFCALKFKYPKWSLLPPLLPSPDFLYSLFLVIVWLWIQEFGRKKISENSLWESTDYMEFTTKGFCILFVFINCMLCVIHISKNFNQHIYVYMCVMCVVYMCGLKYIPAHHWL